MANAKFTSRDIKSVATIRTQIVGCKKKQLVQTLRLAEYALKAKLWWKSPEFKATDSQEDRIREVFGCSKGYFHKLCRAAEAVADDANVIQRYHDLCDAVDAECNVPTTRSLADFLLFLKDEENHKSVPEDTTEGEGEAEEPAEDDSPTSGVMFTFSAPGVSIRVYDDGRVVKDGEGADDAVAMFIDAIAAK